MTWYDKLADMVIAPAVVVAGGLLGIFTIIYIGAHLVIRLKRLWEQNKPGG